MTEKSRELACKYYLRKAKRFGVQTQLALMALFIDESSRKNMFLTFFISAECSPLKFRFILGSSDQRLDEIGVYVQFD